ncbi:MAG TPA: hypothetical protein IAC03_06380 [Candidatus Coprenecus pullistercoris]|nr:hypothetical protein [Candidatus Coprenecus pullistercoris]
MRSNFFSWAAVALSTVALTAAVSCNKPDEGEEPGAAPTVTITMSEVGSTTASFTLASTNADRQAYMLVADGEAVPTAETIFAEGTTVDVASTEPVVLEGLTPETQYTVAAAAASEDVFSAVDSKSFKTVKEGEEPVTGGPSVTLDQLRGTKTGVSFTFTQTNAEKIAYIAVKEAEYAPMTAEDVFANGTEVTDLSVSEIRVEGCESEQMYYLVVAAANSDEYSDAVSETFETLKDDVIDRDLVDVVYTDVDMTASSAGNGLMEVTAVFTNEGTDTLSVNFFCNFDENNMVAAGEYSVSDTEDAGNVVPGAVWFDEHILSGNEGTVAKAGEKEASGVVYGSMTVAAGNIAFDFTFDTDFVLTGSFAGDLKNTTSVTGSTMTEDILDVTFEGIDLFRASTYYKGSASGFDGSYVIFQLKNSSSSAKVNDFQAFVYCEPNAVPTGTFEVNTAGAEEYNTWIPGKVNSVGNNIDDYNGGTGLIYYNENGEKVYCPASSGTVTFTENGDGTYTLSFDLYDDLGHNFTGSYTSDSFHEF